ncbi:AI-2E family transporter, partial [bacterium]
MPNPEPTLQEKDYLAKSLDIAVRLGLLAVIFVASLKIFGPFLPTLIWGSVIAIALYPLFEKLNSSVGGKRKLAGALFIIVTLALVIAPTWWLGGSLLDGTVRLVHEAGEGTLLVPAPTDQVREWPLIGEKAWLLWDSAHRDLSGTIEKLQPQIGDLGRSIVGAVTGLGGAILHTILALIIAGILMISAPGTAQASSILARRLGGDDGPRMVDTAVGTIRSVVKGVILVALIQGLLAAVGLSIAHVPAAGLWAALVIAVAIIQLPPILILLPAAIYVFSAASTLTAVLFLVFALVVSASDAFLKPLFLGRGMTIPMPVILLGAIGGMMLSGIVGLFIGAVVLALGYELAVAWVKDEEEDTTGAAE